MPADGARVLQPADDGADGMQPTTALVGFARALRGAGLPVTPDRTAAFVGAAAAVGIGDPGALYWAGRATLCSDPDQFPRYDVVFRDWFGGQVPRFGGGRARSVAARTSIAPDDGTEGPDRRDRESEVVRARASAAEVLRERDVAELTAAEKALLAQLFATLSPAPRSAAHCAARPGTPATSMRGGRCARSCAAAASPAGCGTAGAAPGRAGWCFSSTCPVR